MKTMLVAAFTALALGIAGTANAQVPCGTGYGNWNNSSAFYPTTSYGYGYSQPYGGYSNFPQYGSSYPQYGSSWNTSTYRAPNYTYDPVHRDYHVNNGGSFNQWNNGFGNTFSHHRNW